MVYTVVFKEQKKIFLLEKDFEYWQSADEFIEAIDKKFICLIIDDELAFRSSEFVMKRSDTMILMRKFNSMITKMEISLIEKKYRVRKDSKLEIILRPPF